MDIAILVVGCILAAALCVFLAEAASVLWSRHMGTYSNILLEHQPLHLA